MERTAAGPGSDVEHGQRDDDVPRSSNTEDEWKCVQCGQGNAQGTNTCDACGAEAAFVDVVMQDAMPPGSGTYLDHEMAADNISQLAKYKLPESQSPRAFMDILKQVNKRARQRPHCPTEGGVESTEDCEVLMQVQRHGTASRGWSPSSCSRRSRGQE